MGKSNRFFTEEREQAIRDRKYFPTPINECYPAKVCPQCNGDKYFAESQCCGASIVNGVCSLCGEHTSASRCDLCDATGHIPVGEEEYYDKNYK